MLWIPLRSSWTRFSEDTQDSKEIKALIQGVQSALFFFFFSCLQKLVLFLCCSASLYSSPRQGSSPWQTCFKVMQMPPRVFKFYKRLGDVHTMVSERIKRGEQHGRCSLNKLSNRFILACMHHFFLLSDGLVIFHSYFNMFGVIVAAVIVLILVCCSYWNDGREQHADTLDLSTAPTKSLWSYLTCLLNEGIDWNCSNFL